MKKLLFTNWHLMRYIRILLALYLFYNAYETREWFFIAFGLFFLIQGILNLGCSPNGCNVQYNKKHE